MNPMNHPLDEFPSKPLDSFETEKATTPLRRVDDFWFPPEACLDAEVGRAIGHDFARLGMPLPAQAERALVEGYTSAIHSQSRAIRNIHNQREAADPGSRKLVRLRHSAWKRNRIVDESVTPKFLNLIQVTYCPITRVELTHGAMLETDATIDRIYNNGAYAAGNLAVLSQRANSSKANRLPEEISEIAKSQQPLEGLSHIEWCRMACLCEMASPDQNRTSVWPLLVIPPNGIMITNPLVLIMEFFSVIACGMLPHKLCGTARNLLSGKKEKKSFDEFISAYAGRLSNFKSKMLYGDLLKQKMGDLWAEPMLWSLFVKLLKFLNPDKIKALSLLAGRSFYGDSVKTRTHESLIKSWHLESRGYVTNDQAE